MAYLVRYAWPGNVRELKNLSGAIFVGLPPGDISTSELPPYFVSHSTGKVTARGERDRLLSALSLQTGIRAWPLTNYSGPA